MANECLNLNDDMVKLVAYAIISVRRGHERIMPGGEGTLLVVGRMTPEAFTAQTIARYVQKEIHSDKEDAVREVVEALDRYLRGADAGGARGLAEALKLSLQESLGGAHAGAARKLRHISEEDRRYLRVHYVVSNRWPREPKKFEERQVAVLEEIGQAIAMEGECTSPSA